MSLTDSTQKTIDAINRHDVRGAVQNYASDAVVHDPFYPEPLRGIAAIEKDTADFFRAFPDLRVKVRSMLHTDNIVAGEFSMNGTNTGPLAGPDGEIPASGKKVSMDMSVFSHYNSQGKIVEEHRYYNVAGILEQLGLT